MSLLGLAGELGDLNSTFKKLVLQRDSRTLRSDLREDIGDILWYLTSLAVLHKIPLQEAARESALKAERLYTQGEVNHFDDGFDEEERLPRQFSVTFSEKRNGKQVLVRIMVSGVIVGDTLTDNAHKGDGYRYHDVFHLAYAAVLGWSPVIRSLLRRKRKATCVSTKLRMEAAPPWSRRQFRCFYLMKHRNELGTAKRVQSILACSRRSFG